MPPRRWNVVKQRMYLAYAIACLWSSWPCNESGLLFNINQYKHYFSRCVDCHDNDKTVVRPSYLYHGDPYTGKTASLYWNTLQVISIYVNDKLFGFPCLVAISIKQYDVIIGSCNGLSPIKCHAIVYTNTVLLWIGSSSNKDGLY